MKNLAGTLPRAPLSQHGEADDAAARHPARAALPGAPLLLTEEPELAQRHVDRVRSVVGRAGGGICVCGQAAAEQARGSTPAAAAAAAARCWRCCYCCRLRWRHLVELKYLSQHTCVELLLSSVQIRPVCAWPASHVVCAVSEHQPQAGAAVAKERIIIMLSISSMRVGRTSVGCGYWLVRWRLRPVR